MAKKKRVVVIRNPVKTDPDEIVYRTPDYTQQMEILAIELSLAGGQVLRDEFGFDEQQVAKWMDTTLTVAKKNRATMLARVVESIDNG